ncbi:MAG: Fis family transcriptional regulator [Candidatus Handelsmanbacteria bacterium RIFCSPLOWO2_12_FULL_64_10]|uniref:Fis family transcriptional regulator n=1 Tax=Handelsmanbacteria sp. (strain RIFCSPLOWO2_12_FULL_64_10) TaxID=1817868 RepID=A0A1F6C4E1_HANXR|nr:MAG: Fis family transcriptional regulator [Candidatus Handelsmanbacteria bacterium RIFCSPLOWO2_12_FULL_64_10]
MDKKPRILVVDDEEVVVDSLKGWFSEDGYPVGVARSGKEALARMQEGPWDIALVDIKMPGMDGLEAHRRLKELDPDLLVIIMTAYASVETAVQALKAGAYDYITKPFDPDDLEHLINKAVEQRRLKAENAVLKERLSEALPFDEIVGQSPAILGVVEQVKMVAGTDATALIAGESGTGKELVARAIHAHSPRRGMPMVTVNCGGLAEGLLESELFGHEKGAFTGAQYRKKGKFELADGGTIFLDEVGDVSPKTQIDLLRVLDEKKVTRVGGTQPIDVDFRVVAATNRDLHQMVEAGQFRLDLYYRLNVYVIHLPALRERPEDIPLLAEYFLKRHAQTMRKRIERISPEAMGLLMAQTWPGNVRELENAVERAVVVGSGPGLRPEDLPFRAAPKAETDLAPRSLSAAERTHIARVLQETGWNISQAARLLEIDRVTLYNKIKKYGLERDGQG